MFGYLIAKNKFQTGTMRPVCKELPAFFALHY